MRYRIEFTEDAKKQLRALPPNVRRDIGYKLVLMEEDLTGDVKKLKGFKHEYRLRVGNYRVIFELQGEAITVYAIGDRKDIYS
jgi:mRNA interferase RelE/StbE